MNASIATMLGRSTLPNVESSIVQMTPEMAATLLDSIGKVETMIGQRGVSDDVVDFYARQMESGKWEFNGEPIIVSDKGFLMDGQHRCRAVIKSNATVPMLLIRGIDSDPMDTIDQNRVRTAKDILTMVGYKPAVAQTLAAGARCEIFYQRTGHHRGHNKRNAPSNAEIRDFVSENPAISGCAYWANEHYKNGIGIQRGFICWMHYRLTRIDPERGESWLERFCSGAGLEEHDTRLWIRTKLARESASTIKTKPSQRELWLVKAWNRHRAGKSPQTVNNFFSPSQINAEPELAKLAD